jgi:hypothetical protein
VPASAPTSGNGGGADQAVVPVIYEVVLHKPIHAKDGWKAFRLDVAITFCSRLCL